MESNLGARKEQSWCLHIFILRLKLMIILRGKGKCPEHNMAKDRVLKMKGWVIHMDKER